MPDVEVQAISVMHSLTMFRNVKMQAILLGIALGSASCWLLLVVMMPAEGSVICGGNGIGLDIQAWSIGRLSSLIAMWAIMTPAMMLPAAAPAVVKVSLGRQGGRGACATAASFTGGYLLIMLSGGIAAAMAQWALESTGAVVAWTTMANPTASGLLLVAAGLRQMATLRNTPAAACGRLSDRDGGDRSAVVRGMRHGRTGFGCCAGMICLQFAGGAMNIGWMALLSTWMLAEAVLPWKKHVAALAGTTLLVAGGLCLSAAT